MKTTDETDARAQALWDAFDANQRHGVRFGLFPYAPMKAATDEGYDGRQLSTALMAIAAKNGGMRA